MTIRAAMSSCVCRLATRSSAPASSHLGLVAMEAARRFLTCLQRVCALLGRLSPVISVQQEGEWVELVLNPRCMQGPSAAAVAAAAQGFVDVQLGAGPATRMHSTGHAVPECFYHGTSPEALLAILLDGRIASGTEVGLPRCRPDGVYAYSTDAVSEASQYVDAGAQLRFRATCAVLSYADTLSLREQPGLVPEGGACRMKRSAARRHGAGGVEWIFHPASCELFWARVRADKLDRLAQAASNRLDDLTSRPQPSAGSSGAAGAASSSSGGPAPRRKAPPPPPPADVRPAVDVRPPLPRRKAPPPPPPADVRPPAPAMPEARCISQSDQHSWSVIEQLTNLKRSGSCSF